MGLGWLALLTACSSEREAQSRQERIQTALAEKIDGWIGRRQSECRDQALAKAFGLADSLMLEYAREQALMLNRPSRPMRPDEPELRRPSDTLRLSPFIDSL